MIYMRTLGTQAEALAGRTYEQGVDAAFLYRRGVGLELGDIELSVTPHEVKAAVVVEEHRGIVHGPVDDIPRPCSVLYVVSGIDIGLALVVRDEQRIVQPVLVPEGRRPLALAVGVLPVTQVVDIVVLEDIVHIVDYPPVHEILRVHDRSTGAVVHSGAHHVVVVADAYHVVVGNVGVGQRVHRDLASRRLLSARSEAGKRQHGKEELCNLHIETVESVKSVILRHKGR